MPQLKWNGPKPVRGSAAGRHVSTAGWLGLALVFVWPTPPSAADLDGAASLRAAVEDLSASFPEQYGQGRRYLDRLDELEKRAVNAEDVRAELAALRREALVANPLVSGRPIVFVVRRQYSRDHHNTGTMFQPGEINAGSFQAGGAVKTIDFARGGKPTTLLEVSDGVARDLEVSFDGRKLLFAMRSNATEPYHIHEMNADGGKPVQLTFGRDASDVDPAYLPDGRIVFAATRDPKYCGCNRHIQANLFVMDADGANVHQIGRNNLFESRPSVMPDGRILYDRWEYVDRHFGPSFGLWTVHPDGTNHALFYGNNAWSPGAIFDARAIPGTRQFVAVFGACHDRPWGALVVVDRSRGLDGMDPIVRSWPADIASLMPNPQDVPRKTGIEHPYAGLIDTFVRLPVKYEDPWPLSEKYFLCSRMTGDAEQMGIFLLDVFGNEVLLHTESPGCFDPMPLAPRRRPPVMTARVDWSEKTGAVYVADVYRGTGMKRVPRGTVKTIRVVEAPPKRHWTRPGHHWHVDTHQAPAMNFNCTNNKRILGDAPVEPDGSAYFEVPADRFVFFQLLDGDGMMVQSMRSGTTVQPGERIGCVGCHEDRLSGAPSGEVPMALGRPPGKLKPWYGPAREFNYLSEVQPVFDKHCVRCHDYGEDAGRVLNLAGDAGLVFNTSYLDLRTKSPIRWHADRPDEPKPLVKAVDDGPPQVLPPYAWGSHRSRLVDVIRSEHYEVKLDRENLDRIITWIDLNAPYYGSYASAYPDNLFGRSPLDDGQLAQLAELTSVPLNARNVGAELNGSQISFTRPELSPCLAKLDKNSQAYQEAREIIHAGQATLAQNPRVDMPAFRLVSHQDRCRQDRCEMLAQAETRSRKALATGQKHREKPDQRPPVKLVSPVAVARATGPAFPLGRKPGNPPDPQYAAERAIDDDPNTFCCLLDDTRDGKSDTTIPARAAEPVTGHIVFDLGRPLPVRGARLVARKSGGPLNPRQVEFFRVTGDKPPDGPAAAQADTNPKRKRDRQLVSSLALRASVECAILNHSAGDLKNDSRVESVLKEHTYAPLRNGAAADVFWDEVTTRYVGLRVKSSYESGGPVHYNFQIAEMQVLVDSKADVPPEMLVGFSERRALTRQTAGLRAGIEDLLRSFPRRYPGEAFLKRLTDIEKRLGESFDPNDRRVSQRFEALKREALIDTNPLIPEKLLFVKRYTYSPGWYYAEFMRASRFGGNLCVLDVRRGKVKELAPKLAGGIFDRCELSFDGRRVVFGYKAAPGKGFRIWEVNVDGTGLRQLTIDPPDEEARIAKYWHPRNKPSGVYRHHTDDFHPCYLPDGGICFASTRCEQGVLCDQGDSLSVNVLYRMDADGGNIRRLSQGALSESTPSVSADGRILYTRWEYVDKGVIAVQALWAMRPDGSGSAEIYGNQIEFPPVLIHGRAVPGTNHLFVATATMHHPFAVGPIMLVDARRDVNTHEPLRSVTPKTSLSIEGVGGFPRGEKFIHLKNGRWVADNAGPLYSEPYPLADPKTGAGAGKYFLVDCNPDQPWNHASAYGLYLIDTFGNQVKIYDDPQISCWQPIPLRPRNVPPVIAGNERSQSAGPDEAVAVMSDVYRGLKGVERSTIKYLRVLEQVPRPWSARRFWPHDETQGQHAVISMHAHIFVKIHHGVVPVHEDGSAHFVVPADKNVFFQALDENYMEVQRMRSFVNFQPGESRSCIGCHEPKSSAPPPRMPLALSRPPARLAPQPGETVPRTIHYMTDVQPVWDKHCVRCHNQKKPDGNLDLGGELTTFFNRSYEAIMNKKLMTCIQEFHGPQPRAQKTNTVTLPPYSLGSHASRLIALVRKGHYDCRLSPAEWARLVTWADANSPYYGSYFGRRNLVYREHPDFRPKPTLQSACGIPP